MTRVLHLSPTDTEGGACLGAYKLHKALQSTGVDSKMLVLRKFTDDPSVTTLLHPRLAWLEAIRDRLDRLPLRHYNWQRESWWSVGWLPFDVRRAVDRLKPDVVQLHWAGRGMIPVRGLAALRHYPLLWTLRDMWPLTGGCHYAGDCRKFATGCGACGQLGSTDENDLSRQLWQRKNRHWRDVPITYVTLSNWMSDLARQSPLLFGNEIVRLPNGVDIERFKPLDKVAARAAWNLPQDRQIVLFGAVLSVRDPRKGFAYLAEALRQLAATGRSETTLAVVFGAKSADLDVGIPVRYVGHIDDDAALARLYAAADVMVVPSLFENAAKTAIEALACGTPVTAFANTGQFDLVDHKINGYLARDRSSSDLAAGIGWCLDQAKLGNELSAQARLKAESQFDIALIARRHEALYQRLLDDRQAAERTGARSAAAGGFKTRDVGRPTDVLKPLLDSTALPMGDGGAR